MVTKYFILGWSCLALLGSVLALDPEAGTLEGHLTIAELKKVELAGTGAEKQLLPGRYADWRLVIRSGDGANEIARVAIGPEGTYRAQLPPGNYLLETPLASNLRRHLHPTSRPFTISANQTVRVDMTLDTGVR